MSSTVQKIRANRKTLEQNCSICNIGFMLAEEVYQCSTCGGYHHISCWDNVGACPQTATVASMPLPPPPSVVQPPASSFDTGMPPASYGGSNSADLKSVYTNWSTEQLEDALSVDRNSYSPTAIPLMEAEWRSRGGPPLKECPTCHAVNKSSMTFCIRCGSPLQTQSQTPTVFLPSSPGSRPGGPPPPPIYSQPMPAQQQPAQSFGAVSAPLPQGAAPMVTGEKRCPACAEMIKREAVKCRYCGHLFDSRYGAQQPGGYFDDAGKRLAEDSIRSDAKTALIMSIVGIFCFGIILEPIALYKGSRTLSQIGSAERQYTNLDIGSARGQAIASIIIGICALLISIVYILGMIASSGAPPRRY